MVGGGGPSRPAVALMVAAGVATVANAAGNESRCALAAGKAVYRAGGNGGLGDACPSTSCGHGRSGCMGREVKPWIC